VYPESFGVEISTSLLKNTRRFKKANHEIGMTENIGTQTPAMVTVGLWNVPNAKGYMVYPEDFGIGFSHFLTKMREGSKRQITKIGIPRRSGTGSKYKMF